MSGLFGHGVGLRFAVFVVDAAIMSQDQMIYISYTVYISLCMNRYMYQHLRDPKSIPAEMKHVQLNLVVQHFETYPTLYNNTLGHSTRRIQSTSGR